ncbi:LutC/YkgG family protein [Parapedobacter lycopersici]|uniref:LutC/YkgG family protein n=1 Tax=Parapedobacter lycopersici TaxID=1864939 RepID=UPI003556C0F4
MQKNTKHTTSKELMLKKVRQALLQKREHPYPSFEETPLYPEDEESIDIRFARQFTAVAGQFVYCEDELQLIENLVLLAEKEKLRKMYAWEPHIQELLARYDFPVYVTDQDFADAEAGITACEALVARSGSILVSNGNAAGRRLGIYPHIHIVIAFTSQLVWDIKDGLALVTQRYGDRLPSMINLITGPSRTADIEKTLVMGAHGPKNLYLFLLEG